MALIKVSVFERGHMAVMRNFIRLYTLYDEKFYKYPAFIAIRRGLIYMIPTAMIGSFALLLSSFPLPAYQSAMQSIFGDQWGVLFTFIKNGTFSIISLIVVICISHSYAVEKGYQTSNNASPLITSIVALSSFFALSGIGREDFSISSFGVVGVFIAIMVSVLSSMLFLKLSGIKVLQIKVLSAGANAFFNLSIASIIPAALTILVFAAVNHMLNLFFQITDVQEFLSGLMYGLFSGIKSPLISGFLFILLIHLFWFFGLHGSNILEPVAQSIYMPALDINQHLITASQQPTEVFTKTFFDTFVLMGGCGAAICLVIAVFIAGRFKNQTRLAKLSAAPVLFNINELIVFGMPIVFNPVYLIPFILVPMLLTATSYLAVTLGFVPYTRNMVEWTTPILLSGYAATGSVAGSLLQVVNVAIGTAIYVPFVKLARIVSEVQMKNNLKKVYDLFSLNEKKETPPILLMRHDEIGMICRFLAADFEHDLKSNKLELHYQPQVDYDGTVSGVEALLRWKHDSYGYVHPPLIIALAEEAGLIDKLGGWIFDTACRDLKKMNRMGLSGIIMSVNVSAVQLENVNFAKDLAELLTENHLMPGLVRIEITERTALTGSKRAIDQITAIRQLGVMLAMDDFGMGHSSLVYLKEYEFDTIKLDGSLVKEVTSNSSCRSILSSIVFLGKSLNHSIIAEYVETEEQREALHTLGCDIYQGYLYSKAVPYKELIDFILHTQPAQCYGQLAGAD